MSGELVNAKDSYQKIFGLKRRPMTRNVEPTLNKLDIPYSKFGDELLISPEYVAAWEERLAKEKEERAYKPENHAQKIKRRSEVGSSPELMDEVATLRADMESMFEIVNNVSTTVDGLHKGMEQLNQAYNSILKSMEAQARPGIVVKLPTRYKYKILIVGGDYRTMEGLEDQFPQIRFAHIESAGAAGKSKMTSKTIPSADKVFLMTSYMGHSLEMVVRARYRGEEFKIDRISGGVSALNSAISVWLHEQTRNEKAS